jgi:hypothetical protein
MSLVTALIVGQNNKDLLRLTVESLYRHNREVGLRTAYFDNDSGDGAREWAEDHCDLVVHKAGPLGHHHAVPLDRLAQLVKTPYTLTLDNDVVFRGPVLPRMVAEMDETYAFAAAPSARLGMGSVVHFGRTLEGQPRVDPCCAMFRSDQLARMVRHVSFTPAEVTNLGRFYDTGGMVRAAAEGAGMRVLDCPWVWEHLDHFGAMTWAGLAPDGSPEKAAQGSRYETARARLDELLAPGRRDTEVVVARYREDLSWLARLEGVRHRVYAKGEMWPGADPLMNVGREAHTYATHVANWYDELAEVTVFTQGDPFPHAPNFLEDVKDPTCHFRPFGPNRLLTGPAGDSCHYLPAARVWKDLTGGRPFPAEVRFAPGAVFAAHRDCLRRYPRAWWRRLADYLARADTQDHAPWVLERLWAALLGRAGDDHFYHTIPGWFASPGLYRRMVREAADGAHFVEVGCYLGASTSCMAVEILNSGKKIRFDAVDTFGGTPEDRATQVTAEAEGGSFRQSFERNIAPAAAAVNVIQSTSVEAAARYEDGSLTFVYVDADHAYEAVKADLKAWWPKVKPGGWIGGDDYTYHHRGVIQAVDEFFGYPTRVSAREWLALKPLKPH